MIIINLIKSFYYFTILDTIPHNQLVIEGIKLCLAQNKEMVKAINDIKHEQTKFNKEIREQFNELTGKVDQSIIPENSYWRVYL